MDKNLKKILIKTKKGVFSQHIGNNSSKFKGDGYDFVELREYEDGEDIRKIDWVISAKMQKPYVKVFHTQRELNINIVPILGGSVFFGTTRLKKDLITEICAILGYSTVAQGDSFMSFIANDDIVINTKKSKRLFAVDTMAENIYSYNPINKKTDHKKIISKLFKQLNKRSIIFLIGDFLSFDNIDLKLLSKKHEVVAIIVRDRFEESPIAMGNVNFTDPESGRVFDSTMSNSLVKEYEKKIKSNDHKLLEELKRNNISFTKVYTDENPLVKLIKLFS